MIEFGVKYRPGKRTFTHLFLRYGWWLTLLSLALCYFSYAIYFGSLQQPAARFLAAHQSWYLTTGMLAEWPILVAVALLLIAYLRASVHYRAYSFLVDEHALHLRRGLIRVQEITIPYHQISNIHIEQPYHWRFLGLAELDITVASSRESLSRVMHKQDFLIPCIDIAVAHELSHFLVKEASGEGDHEEDEEWENEEDGEDIAIQP